MTYEPIRVRGITMSAETIANVRRLFEETWNTGNMAAADEMLDPNYVDHSTLATQAPGIEGFKGRIAGLRKTFPDSRFTIEDIFADGDRVAFRWTITGTDTGGFMGRPPTGKSVVVTGINIERIADGKVAEHWSSPDNLGMMRQLGMIPG
jgi:steroid delta-isomerase-like uncharacterized protein